MSEIPTISEEYNYFEKLFDKAEKEQIDDLYKKELYIMKEDLKNNESKSRLKLMHDILLKKLYCEDFQDFTPKNEIKKQINSPLKQEQDNILKNDKDNNKNSQKEDLGDKELQEEIDYLKTISRLNYLTFSPLALDSFEKINNFSNSTLKKEQNIKGDYNINIKENSNDIKDKKDEEEKEKKLLGLLDFDYNNFELNNDLLFNISQGFIDVSKLKEQNIKIPNQEQLKEQANNNSSDSSLNDEYDLYEYDEELEQILIDRTMNFVHKYESNLIFKGAIIRFKEELKNLPQKSKNKVKNAFYRKWENEFIKLGRNNEKIQRKNAEDLKKKEYKQQREYLDKLNNEKIKEKEEKEKYHGYGDELFVELQKLKKNSIIKMENKASKKRDNYNIKKKKKFNKSVSNEKNQNTKSKKKFYCSGFNIYKEIINNKLRNNSENKYK